MKLAKTWEKFILPYIGPEVANIIGPLIKSLFGPINIYFVGPISILTIGPTGMEMVGVMSECYWSISPNCWRNAGTVVRTDQ